MTYAAGVDVGSTQTKAIIVDERGQIVARALTDTGAYLVRAAERAFQSALDEAGLRREQVGTVIDIGGQDTKAIKVSDRGEVLDFAMNDKCAAGSGRFLTNSAEAVGLDVSEMGERSLTAKQPVRLSTVCTIFVESDILTDLAQGKKVDDSLDGVHGAIAARTVALVRRVGAESEITMTGGVARNVGMVKWLEQKLGMPVNVSPDSHYTGALGAAIFAMERIIAGPSVVAQEVLA